MVEGVGRSGLTVCGLRRIGVWVGVGSGTRTVGTGRRVERIFFHSRDALFIWAERGIESMCADTTAIGTYPRDKDNPDFKDVVYHRSHHRYFCWSRLDYHRRRAERAAQWLADCGYRGYYLHATDSGGWSNPALWDDRCDECRKNYGDDHAKADATVFGIY